MTEKTKAKAKRRVPTEERPPAPWGSFPLAELTILAGIVALVVGLVGNKPTALGIGVALAGLGGLEVAVREHFAGYRSHTTLIAGVAFLLATGILFFLVSLPWEIALAAGVIAFAASFFLLRRAFQRASGGFSFKAGGLFR